MKKITIISAFILSFLVTTVAQQNIYNFKVNNIKSEKADLKQYQGKVILIVNTASKCGLTPQYEGLEALYQKYKSQGFVVLGFPCNQFLGQEPGTAEEIEKFCSTKYNITFPLFEKIEVNGKNTHPLYKYLKATLPREDKNEVKWNFEKFLIDKTGKPVKRYTPTTKPVELENDIESLLK